jgi:hypothetical protein
MRRYAIGRSPALSCDSSREKIVLRWRSRSVAQIAEEKTALAKEQIKLEKANLCVYVEMFDG